MALFGRGCEYWGGFFFLRDDSSDVRMDLDEFLDSVDLFEEGSTLAREGLTLLSSGMYITWLLRSWRAISCLLSQSDASSIAHSLIRAELFHKATYPRSPALSPAWTCFSLPLSRSLASL